MDGSPARSEVPRRTIARPRRRRGMNPGFVAETLTEELQAEGRTVKVLQEVEDV